MIFRKILAWSVHAYTASGLVAAAGIAVSIVKGTDASFRVAFVLMLIATVIDTTDGWLARKAEVKKFAASLDGRRLDDLIDFQTYTSLPLLLIWRAQLLPPGWESILLLPLLASAYGFSQVAAKTADNFFLGFPSYWNIVAIYLYLLKLPAQWSAAIVVILALLTFVPSLYLYTTRGGRYSTSVNILGGAWALAVLWILLEWEKVPGEFTWISLAFPVYYFGLSWWVTIRTWQAGRSKR